MVKACRWGLYFGLCCLIFLVGCSQATSGNPQPASEFEGFYAPSQRTTGGDAQLKDGVNLKGIHASEREGVSMVEFSFQLGSDVSDVDVATISAVPAYEVYCLETPSRLVVKLYDVDFWDYQLGQALQNTPYIEGVLRQIPSPSDADKSALTLYLQLKSDAAFKCSEEDGKLNIELRPLSQKTQGKRHFVVLNDFADYQEGKLDQDMGITPVLASDSVTPMLISKGYASASEADGFKAGLKSKLQTVLPSLSFDSVCVVQVLDGDALPEVIKVEPQVGDRLPVVKPGSSYKSLNTALSGGMYLATKPDTGQLLYAKTLPYDQTGDIDENRNLCYLYLVSGEREQQLIEVEFSDVTQAKFSPDGQKLAFKESSASGMETLYVYDLGTRALRDLGEEGLGLITNVFDWGEDSGTIYSISGTEDSQQLSRVKLSDRTAPGGGISTLLELSDGADSLAFNDGKLYFPEVNDETGENIIAMLELGNSAAVEQPIIKGSKFKLSPDGRYLAVLGYVEGEEESQEVSLRIHELKNGNDYIVLERGELQDFQWEKSGEMLYYLTPSADEAGQYPYVLNSYNVPSDKRAELLQTSVMSLAPAEANRAVYLLEEHFSASEEPSYYTYRLELN